MLLVINIYFYYFYIVHRYYVGLKKLLIKIISHPLGNSHLFVVSQAWAKLQRVCFGLLETVPEIVYSVKYENILADKEKELENLEKFLFSLGGEKVK